MLENRVRLSQNPAKASPLNGAEQPSRLSASQRPEAANTATAAHRAEEQAYSGGALDTIFRGMRPKDPGPGAPWDPPATPMAGGLAAFESRMQESRNERALRRAEKSGRAALDALDAFRTGKGAIVMNRIRDAAGSEPGGIAAVLSEMRVGGRFADLRQQFNSTTPSHRAEELRSAKAALEAECERLRHENEVQAIDIRLLRNILHRDHPDLYLRDC